MCKFQSGSVVDRRDAGVTLIELMTVLVIVGIMIGLAAPSMSGILGVNRAESAASQVAADLMYARILAVRSGDPVTVTFSSTGYQITTSGAATPSKSMNMAQDYPMTTLTPPATQVNFNTRGLVTSGAGDFRAVSGDHSALFTLTAVGGILRAF